MELTNLDASKTVAARVKQQRSRLGWSMRQLAEAAGVPLAAINDIENGRRARGVTVDELMAFAEAFQVSPNTLLPAVRGVDVVVHAKTASAELLVAMKASVEVLQKGLDELDDEGN